jgi:hypothetical protein
VRFVPLVVLFGFFIRWLVLLAATGIAECPPEVVAINCRRIGTWMPWAFLLQEIFELLLRRCLPASRRTIHSSDEVVWLALSGWTRVVPLALVGTIVICNLRLLSLRLGNRSRIFSSCSDQSCIMSRSPATVFGLFRPKSL